MKKIIPLHIFIFVQTMIFLSCQQSYTSIASTFIDTNDGKGARLLIYFTILVDIDKLDDIYKLNYDMLAINETAITDQVRAKIRIFLMKYAPTIDSETLLKSINDGSLNQLIKQQIQHWFRLQGVKFKRVKVVVKD